MTTPDRGTKMIPVPAGLQPGAQTAAWVLEQITTYPETHNQSDWRANRGCQTTYCVAGWAAVAHGEQFINSHNMKCSSAGCDCLSDQVDWREAGKTALMLDDIASSQLFWGSNSRETVLGYLARLAAGKPLHSDVLEV